MSLCLGMDGFSRQAKRPRLRVARTLQPSDAALVSGLPPLETLEEVLALPSTSVNALVNYAKTTNRMDIIDALVSKCKRGVVFSSSYAGMGADHHIGLHMMGDLGRALDLNMNTLPKSCCHSATENDNNAQTALRLHPQGTESKHIFPDILDRLDEQTRLDLEQIEMSSFAEFDTSTDEFERGIINSKELAARKVEMGTTMVNRMRGCLGKAVFKEEVHCIVHERLRPFSPRCDHDTRFHFWHETAGVTCVAFSRLSKKRSGWLHNTTKVCLAWLYSVRYHQPDSIIIECVPGLPFDFVLDILNEQPLDQKKATTAVSSSPVWVAENAKFSPTDLGVPASRGRHNICAHFVPTQTIIYLGINFGEVFFRPLGCDASIFLNVTDWDVGDPSDDRLSLSDWRRVEGRRFNAYNEGYCNNEFRNWNINFALVEAQHNDFLAGNRTWMWRRSSPNTAVWSTL